MLIQTLLEIAVGSHVGGADLLVSCWLVSVKH